MRKASLFPRQFLWKSGKLIRQPVYFPIDTSEGEQLRFPPSDVRLTPLTALCLPFSGFALRPKGHTPLEPLIDSLHKSIKIHLFLGSLSSSRNHARSPPDGFLTRLPDFLFIMEIMMLPSLSKNLI